MNSYFSELPKYESERWSMLLDKIQSIQQKRKSLAPWFYSLPDAREKLIRQRDSKQDQLLGMRADLLTAIMGKKRARTSTYLTTDDKINYQSKKPYKHVCVNAIIQIKKRNNTCFTFVIFCRKNSNKHGKICQGFCMLI